MVPEIAETVDFYRIDLSYMSSIELLAVIPCC